MNDNLIGFIGLGIMGGAMSRHMLAAGLPVVGYDIAAEATQRFRTAGGTPAASVAEVISQARIVFTSLPTVAAFDDVMRSIAQGDAQGRIIVDLCTMPHANKHAAEQALRAAGAVMLDCPLSGTGAQAERRDLVVFGSGDRDAFEAALPALRTATRRQLHLGAFGNGTTMKFLANHLVAVHNVAAAEAMVLAQKAGMDLQQVYDTLCDSAATSRMFEVRGPLMVDDRYDEPTARVSMFLKDIACIGDFAARVHCPTPLFDVAAQLYTAADNAGLTSADTACVKRVLDVLAGVRRQA
jgi:putative dehydrogenase